MANPVCRDCERSADAGACCRSCGGEIMAGALNPRFRVRRKGLPPEQRTLPQGAVPGTLAESFRAVKTCAINVAFETTDYLGLTHPFAGATVPVLPGLEFMTKPDQNDAIEGRIGLPVATPAMCQ